MKVDERVALKQREEQMRRRFEDAQRRLKATMAERREWRKRDEVPA